jgi:hypothetical protein
MPSLWAIEIDAVAEPEDVTDKHTPDEEVEGGHRVRLATSSHAAHLPLLGFGGP